MNILVVFTGGTIGSKKDTNGILNVEKRSDDVKDYYLINHYLENERNDIHFDTLEPICELSENMSIDIWNTLIKELKKVKYEDYDGVIITHGTDTMAYTSNLFGILYNKINIPVVLVGSNYNLLDKKCNGHDNFKYAVKFIMEGKYRGVFVSWRDINNRNLIFLGTRLKQASNYINDYEDVIGGCLGEYVSNIFNEQHITDDIYKKSSNNYQNSFLYKVNRLTNCVMIIQPYVGLDYDNYILKDNIKAVLHGTYHSSTFCLGGGTTSIIYMIKKCRENRVNIYFSPFESGLLGDEKEHGIYFTTETVLKENINILDNISIECSYVKLIIAYSIYDNEKDIKTFLETNISSERFKLSCLITK